MPQDAPPPDDDDHDRGFNNLAAGIAVVLLLIVAGFVVHEISSNMAMERCLEEGHHYCTPPIDTNRH